MVRIPKTLGRGRQRNGQWLIDAVGRDAAEALCQAYGGEHLEMPRGAGLHAKKSAILRSDPSTSHGRLAKLLGCTRRWVRAVRRDAGVRDERQGELW